MKKIILILVGLALLLTICSCTGNKTEESENGTSDQTVADNESDVTTDGSVEDTTVGTESPNPENDQFWTPNF